MSSVIPPALRECLGKVRTESRGAAWIRVGREGLVRELGGELLLHGLSGLAIGVNPEEAAPFLSGLLPLEGEALVLPAMQLGRGRFSDVHLVPAGDSDWVLLLDASREGYLRLESQQVYHEKMLTLESGSHEELASVLAARGMLVLERRSPGRFRAISAIPGWARGWVRERGAVATAAFPPFLEGFLPDAEQLWAAAEGGPLNSGPWSASDPAGGEIHLEACALRLESGEAILLVDEVGRAVREKGDLLQGARDEQLRTQRLRKEMDRKELLLHCIVHDLKGPLTGMVGSLKLLAGGDLASEESRHLIELALRQAAKQELLIRSILEVFAADLSEVEGEGLDQGDPPFALQCARQVVEELRPAFIERGIRIELRWRDPDGRGFQVRGDRLRLERVVANLLENALRHTPRGRGVSVTVEREDDRVSVAVHNDGQEIPPDRRARLFERFGSSGGGSGIGLHYCRLVLERWGGSISYAPRATGGSTFRFELPAR